jgi:hypothetical protein
MAYTTPTSKSVHEGEGHRHAQQAALAPQVE